MFALKPTFSTNNHSSKNSQTTLPSSNPNPYPTSAVTITIIAISIPLRIQLPIVYFAFIAPVINNATVDSTKEIHTLIPTDTKKNGSNGIVEPTIAATPTTTADRTGFPPNPLHKFNSSDITVFNHNFIDDVIFSTNRPSNRPRNPFL